MLVHSFASMTPMAEQSEMLWPANALTSEWTIKQDKSYHSIGKNTLRKDGEFKILHCYK